MFKLSDYAKDGHTFYERIRTLTAEIIETAEKESWDDIHALAEELQATVERESESPGRIFFPDWQGGGPGPEL